MKLISEILEAWKLRNIPLTRGTFSRYEEARAYISQYPLINAILITLRLI